MITKLKLKTYTVLHEKHGRQTKMSYILYHTILSKYYFRGLNQNRYVKLGNGHFSAAKKNWCGYFSPNIKGQFSTVHMYFRQDNLVQFTCILDRTIQHRSHVFQTGQFSTVHMYFRQDNLVLFTCILDRTIQCCLLVRLTGARCVRKKKNNNKILYNTTRGRTHLLPFF